MRCFPLMTLIAAGLVLSSCADFYSIGRRTTLPDNPTSNKGLAIHLDAQQRLMMVGKDGTYCAEASPDAMAAYAAALAASVSAQGYGAGSASNASQSNIASIGLRTQSITLMRDALYRLCEAGANGQLSKMSATQLMARSQDLTAVVVAVEQLTGAVAANQAILTGTSNASASASMIGDAQQLDIATKNLERKQEATSQAQLDRDAAAAAVKAQEPKATAAQGAVDNAPADIEPTELAQLQATRDQEQATLTRMRSDLANQEGRLKNAKESQAHAQEVVDTIAAKNTAAMSDTAASTTGAGQFSGVTPRVKLDEKATEQVAKSVQAMVTTVVNKDYTGADCMFLLTNITEVATLDAQHQVLLDNTLKQCADLLSKKIQAESAQYMTGVMATDDSTARLETALDTVPGFDAKLEAFIARNAPGAPMTNFLTHAGFAQLRQQAIAELLP
ncbi:hypothetical protein [Dongia sp. agr-C8]